MAKKTRKKFSEEEKRKAVADYVSEAKTAQQIANKLGTDIQAISTGGEPFMTSKKRV